ncbi:MAG: hypothetical protein AB7P02_09675 [Alphaproteobacteria bacterium]
MTESKSTIGRRALLGGAMATTLAVAMGARAKGSWLSKPRTVDLAADASSGDAPGHLKSFTNRSIVVIQIDEADLFALVDVGPCRIVLREGGDVLVEVVQTARHGYVTQREYAIQLMARTSAGAPLAAITIPGFNSQRNDSGRHWTPSGLKYDPSVLRSIDKCTLEFPAMQFVKS